MTWLILTIMTIPPTDCTTAINPSDTLSVTAFATKMVSADKRLINSPVLVLSKNAVSCSSMELKTVLRSLTITFCPEITVSQIILFCTSKSYTWMGNSWRPAKKHGMVIDNTLASCSQHSTGMKSFSFLFREQHIVGQKVSSSCWISGSPDVFSHHLVS